MKEVDCYDIKGGSGLRHGFILNEDGSWIYQRDGRRRSGSDKETIINDAFILFRNNTYPDDDNLYNCQDLDGVKAKIDWKNLEVSTSTGVILKLIPNDF